MLINQNAFHCGHCHIGPLLGRQGRQLGAGGETAAHLLGPVLVEQPHGIGPAPGAVTHLGQELLRLAAHRPNFLLGRLTDRAEGSAHIGEHGHAVEEIRPQLLHGLGNLEDMLIVDPRDQDGIDLHRNPMRLQVLDCRQLPGKKQFRRLATVIGNLAIPHPTVNFCPHLRINGIDGDGHMGDIELGQFRDIGADTQTVAGQTEDHLRILCIDQPHGFHGRLRIGKGVAGSGNAGHGDARLLFQNLAHVNQGLLRAQDRAGHPGPRLVDAVVFAVAVIALDIAVRGHRQMDAAGLPFHGRVETGVFAQVFMPLAHDFLSLIYLG